jgi:hypothetical protein
MKKLNMIKINPERLIKTKELKSIRGGFYSYVCWVDGSWSFNMSSVQDNEFAATEECNDFLAGYGTCACMFA